MHPCPFTVTSQLQLYRFTPCVQSQCQNQGESHVGGTLNFLILLSDNFATSLFLWFPLSSWKLRAAPVSGVHPAPTAHRPKACPFLSPERLAAIGSTLEALWYYGLYLDFWDLCLLEKIYTLHLRCGNVEKLGKDSHGTTAPSSDNRLCHCKFHFMSTHRSLHFSLTLFWPKGMKKYISKRILTVK